MIMVFKLNDNFRFTQDIFSLDKVFVPINLSNTHWTLAVVYMRLKEIHYYDSMSGSFNDCLFCDKNNIAFVSVESGRPYLDALMRWLKDESRYKKKVALDSGSWKLIDRESHVPLQENGYDCGVYTITCADFISDDLPLVYSHLHMETLRQKYGCHILRGKFDYPIICKNGHN